MTDKYYFPLWFDTLKKTEKLKDAEFGRLVRALLEYGSTGKTTELPTEREQVHFEYLSDRFDTAQAKCENISKIRSECGSKGGAPTGNTNATKTSKNNQNQAKQAYKKEKEEYKENVSYGHEKEIDATASDERDPCPYAEIMELFNATCTSLPQIRSIDGTRRKVVHARWIAHPDITVFRELFETAQASSFLTGGSKNGWRASFDWLVAPGNFTKVLEGNYADRRPPKQVEDDGRLDFDLEDIFEKPTKESEEET